MPLRRVPLPSPFFRPVLSTSLIFFSRGISSPLRVHHFFPLSFVQFFPWSDTASSTDLSALVHSCTFSASFPFFPFLASGSRRSLHFVVHAASRFVLLPFPRVSHRDSSSASVLVFPVAGSVSLFLSFLLRFLQFPSPSFPFLSSSSLQFSPLLSSSVLPSSSRPHGVPTLPRSSSESRVPPPLIRGSVSVARGLRRSAPTPLQRSGNFGLSGGR